MQNDIHILLQTSSSVSQYQTCSSQTETKERDRDTHTHAYTHTHRQTDRLTDRQREVLGVRVQGLNTREDSQLSQSLTFACALRLCACNYKAMVIKNSSTFLHSSLHTMTKLLHTYKIRLFSPLGCRMRNFRQEARQGRQLSPPSQPWKFPNLNLILSCP